MTKISAIGLCLVLVVALGVCQADAYVGGKGKRASYNMGAAACPPEGCPPGQVSMGAPPMGMPPMGAPPMGMPPMGMPPMGMAMPAQTGPISKCKPRVAQCGPMPCPPPCGPMPCPPPCPPPCDSGMMAWY